MAKSKAADKPVIEIRNDELKVATGALSATRASLEVLEQQEKDLRRRILEICAEFEIAEATVIHPEGGTFNAILTPVKGRKTLNKDKLIDAGVKPAQIEKGYKEGDPYTSVSVESAG